MAKLIIRREEVKIATKPTTVVVDNEVRGIVENGAEISINLDRGKHTLLAVGIANNIPYHQYEFTLTDTQENIVEIKVSKFLVRMYFTSFGILLTLSGIVGILIGAKVVSAVLGLGIGSFFALIFYLIIKYYSKHIHTIKAISGVKLTPLTEDKKYR